MEEAHLCAQKLALGPTRAYPEVRRALDAAFTRDLSDHLNYEADNQSALIATEDFMERVQAFREKRKPRFTGK